MRAPGERHRAAPRAASAAALLVLACASVKGNKGGHAGAGGGAAGSSGASGAAGVGVITPIRVCTIDAPCDDFPSDPIFDGVDPQSDPAALFAAPPAGAAPCITEPEDGALFPNNWLRPRVRFRADAPDAVYQIRVHSDVEANDLVVYTANDAWAMPLATWQALAAGVRERPISVTVTIAGAGAATVRFSIAPVGAPGNIVYWEAKPGEQGAPTATSSSLRGFAPGDETTTPTLAVGDVQMQTRGQTNNLRNVTCVGCHGVTPDGAAVAFLDSAPFSMGFAGISPGRTGLVPLVGTSGGFVTLGGLDAIRQPGLGVFAFSRAHWSANDHLVVSPYYLDAPCGQYASPKANVRLVWIDLEAPPVVNGCPVEGVHFGTIARAGDARGAANPTWSHDGATIVYSSTNAGQDGRLGTGASDLWVVPFGERGRGGDAAPLPGAATPDFDEYYPSFSPDDALVAFDRVPAGEPMYANADAELFVVPATGAPNATRLTANDPPACSGLASPGVNNHWARWAPAVGAAPGSTKRYYWLVFSSNRFGTIPVAVSGRPPVQVSQLYITAIIVDGASMQTLPAIYVWSQDATKLDTTPAWELSAPPPAP